MPLRRALLPLVCVLLALGVRLAVPSGWMVDPARGVAAPLVLCPDAVPAAEPGHGMHGGHSAPRHEHPAAVHPVCPFALAGAPVLLAESPAFAAPAFVAWPVVSPPRTLALAPLRLPTRDALPRGPPTLA